MRFHFSNSSDSCALRVCPTDHRSIQMMNELKGIEGGDFQLAV